MADESEEACLVNPKSPLHSGQMPYTDGVSAASSTTTASGPPTFQQAQSTITHHGGQNTTTANPYDINDDIILSQFHADAIKQACHYITNFIELKLVWILYISLIAPVIILNQSLHSPFIFQFDSRQHLMCFFLFSCPVCRLDVENSNLLQQLLLV